MEHFKRSTSRDFRINCATLDAALREESSEEEASTRDVDCQNHFNLSHAVSITQRIFIFIIQDTAKENEEPPKKKGKK
jgi:hypothetical protein